MRLLVIYSSVKTNVVGKETSSRLIICQIDERIRGNRGRCWWGREMYYNDHTSYAGPVTGDDADDIARHLGMMPFEKGETGCNVLVLNMAQSDLSKDFSSYCWDAVPVLLTHWFWAKMVSPNAGKRIDFHLSCDGDDLTELIPNPETTYPYSVFVRAYKQICDYYAHKKDATSLNISFVNMERPSVEIGAVALRKAFMQDFKYAQYVKNDWSKSTIALMRDVEFVVEYHEEKSIDTSSLQQDTRCFGVFHTNRTGHRVQETADEMERYFHDIENATHDKWTHNKDMKSPNYLSKVLQAIPAFLTKYLEIQTSIGNTASISAMVAQRLGTKLIFGFGSGASETDDKAYAEKNAAAIKKSVFKRRDEPCEVADEKGVRIVKIPYDAKIINGKRLLLRMELRVQTTNPKEYEVPAPADMKVAMLTKVPTGREKMTVSYRPLKGAYMFAIEKSGTYLLCVETHIQCAFKVAVDKEEAGG